MDAAALERFCDDWFRAWAGNEPKRLLDYYADDATYVDPARPGGIMDRGDLAAYFEKLLDANPGMVWTRDRLFEIPGGFVVQWTARIPVNGREIVERGMDLVLLKGRRILRNEVYFDRSRWLAALAQK